MTEPTTSPSPWWKRLRDTLLATPPGAWIILNVASRLDPLLLRLTGGRFSTGTLLGTPALLLTTIGAKTGQPRSVAVLYLLDGDNLALIGSRGGMARHPGWVHNLRAHPEADVLLGSRSGTYHAREASGDERARLWARARDIYRGYDTYEQRARPREIPVIVLTPPPR